MTQDKKPPGNIPVTEDRKDKTPGYDEKNPGQGYPDKTPPKEVD